MVILSGLIDMKNNKKKKPIRIAILGLTTSNGNLGCQALTYSTYSLLKEIFKDQSLELYFYELLSLKALITLKTRTFKKVYFDGFCDDEIKKTLCFYKNIKNKIVFAQQYKRIDFCLDFTYGDSFTDIYGQERFDTLTGLKRFFIKKGKPFILGSQTYGPFNNPINMKTAVEVINDSYEVFARDKLSYDFVSKNCRTQPILTTDVAFFLEYDSTKNKNPKAVGFNPSGLLWNGGYQGKNQFGLSLDYRCFCKRCIEEIIRHGFQVHLIGHVVDADLSVRDNDCVAITSLHEMFPETIVAPVFKTPMDAKTYISSMTFFVGSRMHATIAAISSGVPVLPFSYSRKFEGLFQTLDYHHLIHGKDENMDSAIGKVRDALANLDEYKKDIMISSIVISKMKLQMLNSYKDVFKRIISNIDD